MMFILFGIALLGLIGFGTYFILEQQKDAERRQRALALIGTVPIQKPEKGDKARNTQAEIAKRLKSNASGAQKNTDNKKTLKSRLMQAGLKTSPLQYWGLSGLSAIICTLLAHVFWHSPFMTICALLMGLLGLPKLILGFKIGRRQKAFLNEFADALEAMARLLKAGMPVGEAIAMCAREYAGPVGEEMRRMYDAQKMGVTMAEAAGEAAVRMPVPEMRMLVTALVIQQQTGSSLSEVLENLAGTIRARYRLKRKILALSSEAKASAMIIGCLPLVVAGGLKLVNPEYIGLLFQPGLGEALLYGAGFWMFCGVMVMRQMINFKI